MSILIKGMAMPKNCIYCPMAHWNKLDEITGCEIVIGKKYVDKDDKDYWCGSDIPSWCPLVEIPSHGRLIDADAFFEDICNDINAMTKIGIAVDGDWLWEKLNDALGHAPTIIEGDAG